jgi:3-oxoacyl-[acyl-carrier protein] reductase
METVIISGGAGYVGSAIAEKLLTEGYNVAILYRTKTEHIDAMEKKFSNAKFYQCDISEPERVTELFAQIARTGTIAAVVHAAGTLPKPAQMHLCSAEDLRTYFESDVVSAFNFLTLGAKTFKEQKRGVIIGITTAGVATRTNTKARGLYSPIKFAIQGILVALREEMLPHGVRVYSCAPGVMPGGMNKNTPKAFLDMVRRFSKNNELATAGLVADTVYEIISGKYEPDEITVVLAPESA